MTETNSTNPNQPSTSQRDNQAKPATPEAMNAAVTAMMQAAQEGDHEKQMEMLRTLRENMLNDLAQARGSTGNASTSAAPQTAIAATIQAGKDVNPADDSQVQAQAAVAAMMKAARTGDQAKQMEALQQLSSAVEQEAAKAPKPETQVAPIDWRTEPTPAAATGIQIMSNPHQFGLLFIDDTPFPGRNAPDRKVGEELATIVSSLRIHPSIFFQMLCVMTSNWNQYATQHIDPRMRRPRFKLIDAGEMQLDGVPSETE